jgi:hypothetical protein
MVLSWYGKRLLIDAVGIVKALESTSWAIVTIELRLSG